MAAQLLGLAVMTAITLLRGTMRNHKVASRNRSILAVIAATTLLSIQALAQVSNGTLVGSVLDASGAGVPNAKIEAKNGDTGVSSTTNTTAAGEYRLGGLLAGTYTITATATGFNATSLQNIKVDADKIETQNFTLAVGQVSTNVEVTESVVNIDTTTATIQNTFDQQLTRDLPVSGIGLGVANLSLLGAGVSSNGGIGAGEGPSVGGQRPRNNNFMIEGVDANNKSVTGSLLRTVPNDAVAEFDVLQNQASAQYGHSSGGQFNTIFRSGGNSFHGTAYEYLQNRNLNAIDQQVQDQAIAAGLKPSNPRFDNNRFGGSVGGPILKNKLFFFTDYEYNPVGQSATPASVNAPTAAGIAALSALPNLSATNLAVFKQYTPVAPVADPKLAETVEGVSIPVGSLQFNSPNYQNNQALVVTTDYNISDKDKLSGRYIYNRLSQIDTQATLPVFYTFNNNVYHVASLAEYHNFSPTMVNELRIGFNRFNQPVDTGNFKYPGLDQFPNITINDTLNLVYGPDPNGPQTTIQNTYQLVDGFTWVKGKHTFQFGFDGRRYISPQTFTQRSRGDYEYGTGGSITGLEAFLRDLTPDFLAQRSLGNPVYYGDQYLTAEYAQDTWRFRPNLTIDLGVRYEYTTVPQGERSQILNSIASVPGVLVFGVPQSQTKNFAPRIGLAYSPGNKGTTSIRAGFGMAYDVIYDNIGILALPPQLSTTVDVTNPNDTATGAPNFLKNGGISPNTAVVGSSLTAAQARAQTSAYIPDQKLPYSIQWNIGFQQVFAKDYTFEARYLGTKGVHLDVQQRITAQAVVTASNSLPTYLTAPSQAALNALPLALNCPPSLKGTAACTTYPNVLQNESNLVPLYGNAGFTNLALVEDAPVGYSAYNGLALQLNRRFSNGLQFQGAYTWSHLIDNSTADFNTTALTPRRAQDFVNLANDKSTSALDRRHRFTIAAYYEVPWFKKSNWLMKNIVGNWTASPIYTYESPEFTTVQSGLDSNLNGDSASDRSIINPAGQDGVGSNVTALKNSLGQTVAYLANNPNARYIVAGSGAYPNGGRNTLPGRPIDNVDLNLLKNFSFTERYRLQFSAQFLNLLNHAQFVPGLVDRADNPVVLNTSGTIRSLLIPSNVNFNNPEAVYGSNPRNIVVALKLFF